MLLPGGSAVVDDVINRIGHEAKSEAVIFVRETDEDRERQAHRNPDARLLQCLAYADDMCRAMKHTEVEGQHQQNERDKSDPDSNHRRTFDSSGSQGDHIGAHRHPIRPNKIPEFHRVDRNFKGGNLRLCT